jgi:dipeptidyl-peptidase-4
MEVRTVTRREGRSARYAITFALALLAAPALAAASDTTPIAERYANASHFLFAPVLRELKNNTIVPHWLGQSDRFWYSREGANGSEFVIVDAATGHKGPAFDAPGIAKSLGAILKQDVVAGALPFQTFEFAGDGNAMTFEVEGATFRCALRTSACAQIAASQGVTPDMLVSPDHRLAVFQKAGNLILRDLATGKDRALTTDGTRDKGWGVRPTPSDFHEIHRLDTGVDAAPFFTRWSPDSRRLLTVFTDQSGVLPYPYIEYVPADGSPRPKVVAPRIALAGEVPAKVQFHVFDIASGARHAVDLTSDQVTMIDMLPIGGAWTPDNRHFQMFATAADQRSASLYDIDTDTGHVRQVIHEAGVYPALFNAGGYSLPNAAILKGGKQAIWSSQRDGWPHLYLYDTVTGRQLLRLTSGPWVVRDLLKVDEKRGKLYFVGSGRERGNPYYRSIYRVDLDGRNLTRLTPETPDKPVVNPEGGRGFDGTIPYQPISPSGRYIVYGVSPLDKPTVTLLRRTDGTSPPVVLETADASAIFAHHYRPPEEFTATAADGKSTLWGVVYRPHDYDPSKRYPVLSAEYNSPIVVIVPRNFGAGLETVIETAPPAADAELGFIVVMVDARGTPYRGAAFSDPKPGYLSTMALEDHVAALRQLAARDPSMDMSRVGITGASFGGWTAIRALERFNDTYKVAVAWAPPGNFHTLYDAPGLTAPDGPPIYADGSHLRPTPGAAPVSWANSDAIADIDKLQGKLLIGSGAVDENVLPGSPLRFVDAAAKADKAVEQIFLPNANHGPITYWAYVTHRVWDFLVLNLAHETPPENFVFPPEDFQFPH